MKAVLERVEDIALNIKTFWFKPEQPLNHTAGQYARWYLAHAKADERGERRWFTVSASPSEAPLISITTKFNLQKSSSFKAALKQLQPGANLDVTGPLGDFVLPKDAAIPLVFVAGGIGVTPFRSIIKYLLDTKQKRSIELIYAANKIEEVAFRKLFEAYGLNVKIVLGEPPSDWQGQAGRLDGQRLLQMAPRQVNNLYYLSGPEPMVQALAEDLQKHGLPASQIVTDDFPGYTQI